MDGASTTCKLNDYVVYRDIMSLFAGDVYEIIEAIQIAELHGRWIGVSREAVDNAVSRIIVKGFCKKYGGVPIVSMQVMYDCVKLRVLQVINKTKDNLKITRRDFVKCYGCADR